MSSMCSTFSKMVVEAHSWVHLTSFWYRVVVDFQVYILVIKAYSWSSNNSWTRSVWVATKVVAIWSTWVSTSTPMALDILACDFYLFICFYILCTCFLSFLTSTLRCIVSLNSSWYFCLTGSHHCWHNSTHSYLTKTSSVLATGGKSPGTASAMPTVRFSSTTLSSSINSCFTNFSPSFPTSSFVRTASLGPSSLPMATSSYCALTVTGVALVRFSPANVSVVILPNSPTSGTSTSFLLSGSEVLVAE